MIQEMIQIGVAAAATAIKNGPLGNEQC